MNFPVWGVIVFSLCRISTKTRQEEKIAILKYVGTGLIILKICAYRNYCRFEMLSLKLPQNRKL